MMYQSWLSFFFILLIGELAYCQIGCQDPQALNFNSSATQTDTSCQYPFTQKIPSLVCNLPTSINEASAMLKTDGKWFSINDSGNPADVFQISQTGNCNLIKTTRIINYPNIDWEDLAADSTHLYIGDFGNNNGNRTNLRILKVKKSVLYHPDSLNIRAEKLDFSYPDQTNFISSNTHNFDCEAFIYLKGKLHLFSKNRGNQKTKHYILDPNLQSQVAQLQDSLNVGGLITSASTSPDGRVVVLLGHENGGSLSVFTWLLFGFENQDFFKGNRRKILHNNMLFNGQTEGAGFLNQDSLLISNEQLATIPPSIRKLEIGSFFKPFFITDTPKDRKENIHIIYPNPSSQKLHLNLQPGEWFELHPFNGKKILEGKYSEIGVESLLPGFYWIKIFSSIQAKSEIHKFLKIN